MSTTDGMVEELIKADRFVYQQARLGLDEASMRKAQVDTLTQRIRALGKADTDDAESISTAVENGGWSPAQRAALAAAIGKMSRTLQTNV